MFECITYFLSVYELYIYLNIYIFKISKDCIISLQRYCISASSLAMVIVDVLSIYLFEMILQSFFSVYHHCSDE